MDYFSASHEVTEIMRYQVTGSK